MQSILGSPHALHVRSFQKTALLCSCAVRVTILDCNKVPVRVPCLNAPWSGTVSHLADQQVALLVYWTLVVPYVKPFISRTRYCYYFCIDLLPVWYILDKDGHYNNLHRKCVPRTYFGQERACMHVHTCSLLSGRIELQQLSESF